MFASQIVVLGLQTAGADVSAAQGREHLMYRGESFTIGPIKGVHGLRRDSVWHATHVSHSMRESNKEQVFRWDY